MLAGLLNALKVVGKRIEDVRIVQNGPGAAGTAIIKMLMTAGAKHIVAVDENGILVPGRPAGLPGHKAQLAEITNPERISGTLADAIRGAGRVHRHLGGRRADAGAGRDHGPPTPSSLPWPTPPPEIMPDQAKAAGVRVIGTGRSDFPNQVNNVLAFPGIFKGALSVRARDINPRHEDGRRQSHRRPDPGQRAVRGQHLPKAFDPRIAGAVANAVAKAARESGVARA